MESRQVQCSLGVNVRRRSRRSSETGSYSRDSVVFIAGVGFLNSVHHFHNIVPLRVGVRGNSFLCRFYSGKLLLLSSLLFIVLFFVFVLFIFITASVLTSLTVRL